MHFFESLLEALAACVIHREKGECLRQGHTIRASMQKFNACIHFPKNRTENHLPQCPRGNWPLHKQSRSPCQ